MGVRVRRRQEGQDAAMAWQKNVFTAGREGGKGEEGMDVGVREG